jgi:hypothetical protein
MTRDRFRRTLDDFLEETTPTAIPPRALQEIEAIIGRQKPKPRWLALLTEEPMRSSRGVAAGAPGLRAGLAVFGAGLLLIAVIGGAVLSGAFRPVPPPRPLSAGLLAYDAGGSILVREGDEPRTLIPATAGAASPTWSPDGLTLAYWGASPTGDGDALFVIDVRGGSPVLLVDHLWVSTDKRPAWSPDSRRLAYSTESGPDRNDEDLYIVNADGTGQTRLGPSHPADPIRRLLPAWSPNGIWISFQGIPASLPADEAETWVISANGSEERRVPVPGRYVWPPGARWEPRPAESRLLVAAGQTRSNGDIYSYDVTTGQLDVVSNDPADESSPAWSRDGRLAWLAVDNGSRASIRLVSVDAPETLSNLPASGLVGAPNSIEWSPTGLEIYGSNADKTAVIVVPIDSATAPVEIDHEPGQGMPSWQP